MSVLLIFLINLGGNTMSKKIKFTEIIETLEELFDNCKCDYKSDWIDKEEKDSMIYDMNLLNQSVSYLKRIKENNNKRIFNNIEK